jgi:sodium-dependent dicarboxylate transporter 2/3/5
MNSQRWTPRAIGLFLGPALFVLSLIIPEPPEMIDAARTVGAPDWAPALAGGVLLWVLVWWVTEAVPLGLAALIVPLVFGMAGVVAWRSALSSFTDPIIWIFFAGFVLAASFRKWDLDRRISVLLASVYHGKNPRIAAFFVCCLPVFFLTLTGSITASTTVVFPFLIAYLAMVGVKPGSRYAEGSMLALAQAATAGAMLLLISTAPNLVAKATVAKFAPGENLTFVDWLIVGTPQAIIGLLISWTVTFTVIRPEMKRLDFDRTKLLTARRMLGRLNRGEKTVLGMLLLAVSLWVLPSIVMIAADASPGLRPASDFLAQAMPEAMPAVLVILLAGLLRVKGEPVLRWKEIVDAVDWNVVFLFGGGIVLGLGIEASGLAHWIGDGAWAILGSTPSAWTVFAVSALLAFTLTYAASNTAAALIACPIAATLAVSAGVNPIPPILAAALAASISSAIPSTTPPMAIVYGSGSVKIWDMFRVGIVSDFLRLAVLIATGPFLTGLL